MADLGLAISSASAAISLFSPVATGSQSARFSNPPVVTGRSHRVSSELHTSCFKQNCRAAKRGTEVASDYLCEGGSRNETVEFDVNPSAHQWLFRWSGIS